LGEGEGGCWGCLKRHVWGDIQRGRGEGDSRVCLEKKEGFMWWWSGGGRSGITGQSHGQLSLLRRFVETYRGGVDKRRFVACRGRRRLKWEWRNKEKGGRRQKRGLVGGGTVVWDVSLSNLPRTARGHSGFLFGGGYCEGARRGEDVGPGGRSHLWGGARAAFGKDFFGGRGGAGVVASRA